MALDGSLGFNGSPGLDVAGSRFILLSPISPAAWRDRISIRRDNVHGVNSTLAGVSYKIPASVPARRMRIWVRLEQEFLRRYGQRAMCGRFYSRLEITGRGFMLGTQTVLAKMGADERGRSQFALRGGVRP